MKKAKVIGASVSFVLLIAWIFGLWRSSHKESLSGLPPHTFHSWTLTESAARIPCLQAEIEGIPFQAKLDLGYDGFLCLPKHLSEQLIQKSDMGSDLLTGIRGKTYEISTFTVPQLCIGRLNFSNLRAEESCFEFEYDSNLKPITDFKPSDIMACIGWRPFSKAVLFLDIQNSIAICCDSLETLTEKGHSLKQSVSTQFLPRKEVIEFECQIDGQTVRCLLDTGCTINLIRSDSMIRNVVNEGLADIDFSHPLAPMEMSIEGRSLGPCVFYETQLPLGIEAIVGVDFLKTQKICIDFINRRLFLCPNGD